MAGLVHEYKWQALVTARRGGAFDLDDLDDKGKLIVAADGDDAKTAQPAPGRMGSAKAANAQPPRRHHARS